MIKPLDEAMRISDVKICLISDEHNKVVCSQHAQFRCYSWSDKTSADGLRWIPMNISKNKLKTKNRKRTKREYIITGKKEAEQALGNNVQSALQERKTVAEK